MMSMPADCDEYGAVSNYFSLSCAPGELKMYNLI